MANYKVLVPFILKFEGGFVNDPNDRGGATNKGVTLATFIQFRRNHGRPRPTVEDLKRISTDEWMSIYKQYYWDLAAGDLIHSQAVANIIVDWTWCSGGHALKATQRVLGLTQDGVFGPRTILALNDAEPRALFDKLKAARLAFVEAIVRNNPTQARFINGWRRRINAITFNGLSV